MIFISVVNLGKNIVGITKNEIIIRDLTYIKTKLQYFIVFQVYMSNIGAIYK